MLGLSLQRWFTVFLQEPNKRQDIINFTFLNQLYFDSTNNNEHLARKIQFVPQQPP